MLSPSSLFSHRHRRRKVGLPPGAVVFVGEEKTQPVEFHLMNYDADTLTESTTRDVQDVLACRDSPPISWINVSGVHEEEVVQAIGEHYRLHPLLQEDIVNTSQRPKLEGFDEHLFLVTKMLYLRDDAQHLRAEHVSLVVGDGYLLSFQEDPGDIFEPVRERLRSGRGRIRGSGADYLAYALLDVIVDHYFVVLDTLGTRTEEIEDEVLDDPTPETQERINALRRDLVFMRRMTWPTREVLSQLDRLDSPLWKETTRPFVRDAYDHAVQVLDLVESLRDVVGGLTDLYMTSLSNRMNEIMKVLTIIGTIFIPLTFIAGIYGMNFDYMPELHSEWGYPLTWGVMLSVAAILLAYFRRKGWL